MDRSDEAGTTGARALLERIGSWLRIHDPGSVDRVRALHLAFAFLLAIPLGLATSRTFDLRLDVIFPAMGTMAVMVLIAFTPSSNRITEARSFLILFGLTCALLLAVAAIGPGEGPLNALVLHLAIVPLTGVALYLRRLGLAGMRFGNVMIVMAMVAMVQNPTRAQTLWLLLAACQGGLIAAAVRLILPRPSPMGIFLQVMEEAGAAASGRLFEVGDAVRRGIPVPPYDTRRVNELRTRVRSALVNASQEAPTARGFLETVSSLAYRLRVAMQLLTDCIPSPPAQGSHQAWRQPLAAAADMVARQLENGRSDTLPDQRRISSILTELRQAALDPDLPPPEHLALLRAVTAFERLALVGLELSRLLREGPAGFPPAAPDPAPTSAVLPSTGLLSPVAAVALQGMVATAITTSLDFAFHLSHAYWATMTVVFVLGNSVGETYVRVRTRTVGTAIGVFLGVGSIAVLGDQVWILAAACMISQMISVVTVRDRFDISSAAVGFSVVTALHLVMGLSAFGMLSRIYETVIGAGVALLVSRVVLPVYVADRIREEVVAMVRRCRTVFADCWPRTSAGSPGAADAGAARTVTASMSAQLRQIVDRLPHIGAETSLGRHSAGDVITLVSTLEILLTYQALLEDAAHRLSAFTPPEPLVHVLEAARGRTLRAFDAALGEGPLQADPGTSPDLDAAMSLALDYEDNPEIQQLLPLVADYLSFSDAVLRPLTDLGAQLAVSRPNS